MSTALLFGDRTKPMLAMFFSLAVVLIGAAGVAAHGGAAFAVGLLGFAVHLAWQIWRLDITDPDLCLALFKSNQDAGLILFGGLVFDALLRGTGHL
jgi:4-hydroxybenzoate polyprenyltransferase